MAQIGLKGNSINTSGQLPALGSQAPDFTLVDNSLQETSLSGFSGLKVLNIFPSLDTGICALSVRRFNQEAADREWVTVLNISADLPFAHKRFCAAEGIESATNLSTFRSSFAQDYGLQIVDGPMAGLCSRAVIVLSADNSVLYSEQVPEITQEPDYQAALLALG